MIFQENENALFRPIENPNEVMISPSGMNAVSIIRNREEVIPLSAVEWNYEHDVGEEMDDYSLFRFLSLAEIAGQLGTMSRLLVFVETPTYGYIYRYGNHGAVWEIIGRTCGYA